MKKKSNQSSLTIISSLLRNFIQTVAQPTKITQLLSQNLIALKY